MQNAIKRNSKSGPFNDMQGGTGALRTLLFMTMFGFTSVTHALTFNYDGKVFIPLGLQPLSETVVRMPENIVKYWPEQDGTINFNPIDGRTLSMSPKEPEVEQQVYFLGNSGKLYLGKASTKSKYQPLVEVQDVEKISPTTADRKGLPELAPSTLLFKMMRNELPAGFATAKSKQEILATQQYRIDAAEVWSSPNMTGIVTTISRMSAQGTAVTISPAQIEIFIPELGHLHIIAAESYTLDDTSPSTKGYLVFTKS